MITNKQFLKSVFKQDWERAWVLGFTADPHNHRNWGGGEYRNGGQTQLKNALSKNTFFAISTFKQENGHVARTKSLFDACYVIVLDDIGHKVNRPPVKPSYVLETSPNNQQWGYILRHPTRDKPLLEYFMRELGNKGYSDAGMEGCNRYARLPEGVNTKKQNNNHRHKLITWNPSNEWDLDALIDAFGIDAHPDLVSTEHELKPLTLPKHDPIVDALIELNLFKYEHPHKLGAIEITCPWVHEHSHNADNGSMYFQPGYTFGDTQYEFGAYVCQHEHCKDRGLSDLRHYVETNTLDWDEVEEEPQDQEDLLAPYRISHWLEDTPPDREWVFHKNIPMAAVSMIQGAPGVGKSIFQEQIGIGIATGLTVAGMWEPTSPGKVLIISAEDEREEQHRRLKAVVRSLDATCVEDEPEVDTQMLAENLLIGNFIQRDAPCLLTTLDHGKCVRTKNVKKLIEIIQQIQDLKLIILDPVASFRGGDENSVEHTTVFVEALRYIVNVTGVGILLIHHSSKHGNNNLFDDQHDGRGSSALPGGVRWIANLRLMSPLEAPIYGVSVDECRRYVRLTVTKNNYGMSDAPVWLEKGDDGVLHRADMTRVIADDPEERLTQMEDQVLALIRQEEIAGRRYTQREFEDRFGGVEPLNCSSREIRRIVKIMINERFSLELRKEGRKQYLSEVE